jgi:tRNA threonylcarbamoyladenosine biosynthesis protein TsaE
MRLSLVTKSETETITLGAAIGRLLTPGDIVALHGDLGAGKTRLVRGLAEGAGADPANVSSPTFVIMQEYPCTRHGGPLRTLVHIDAYRLRGADELDTIGWDRITRDLEERRPVAVVIEWAERIGTALPPPDRRNGRLDIRLEHASGGDARSVTLETDDDWGSRNGWDAVLKVAAMERRGATRCPVTGKPVPPDSPTYPFFDERARMADLGRWMSGTYSVSRDLLPEDEADPDFQSR